ncbi:MAG: hypothetical protein QM756_27625 [Polyangiaceae bacterium]
MTYLRALARPVSLALLLSLGLVAAPANAQTDEQRAAARALATEGATAFNEGRFKEAADFFARAESLVHAPPHLLFLARSYAKLGQFVRARETYIKITKEQVAGNAPQAFRDAQTSAQDELRAVEPKIAKLTIQVVGGQDAQNLSVTVDGAVVPPVLIGVPQPVDPGEHRVEAVATGKRARPQTVALRDGERGAVNLQLEPDAGAAPAPPVAAAATPGAAAATPGAAAPAVGEPGAVPPPGQPAPAPAESGGGSNGMRIGGYVATGVGAVALTVGVIFTLKGSSKRGEATDLYDTCGKTCDLATRQKINDLDDQGTKAYRVGVAGLVVGGLAAGTGIALLVMSPKQESSTPPSARLYPVVGPGYLGLNGTF